MEFLLWDNPSCFLLSYLVALAAEVAQVLSARSRPLQTTVFVAIVAGLVAHTAYLMARVNHSGLPPLVGSSHDWLLVLAWLGVVVCLLLLFSTKSAQAIFLLPVIVVLVLLAVSVDAAPSNVDRSGSGRRWAMLHAASLMIGMALVAAASVSALMYLMQYQKLQGKIAWVRRLRLPSLERLTIVNYWLVIGCYPLLTVGLFSGFILSAGETSVPWTDPIIGATVVVWMIMSINLVLLLRTRDQTGRTVARRTLLAGGLLLVSILGLTFVTGGIHNDSSVLSPPPQQEAA